jgi:GNAT superfamily N-acetyltransferase
MSALSDALRVRVGPEPYESHVPRWLVARAEAELIVRYGGLDAGELGLTSTMFEPPAGSFLVARVDGARAESAQRPVGGVGLRSLAEGTGEVRRLWVDPSWRGRGVGRALMAQLEDTARALGLVELVLATGDRQPEAILLYQDTGWTRLYVDQAGKPLKAGWIRFAKAIG